VLKMKKSLLPGLLLAPTGGGLITAPPALADCTSSGGVTICAQGTVDGPSGQPGPAAGPYYPYPCEDDWMCDDGGVSIIVDPGPPRPPIIDRPGRPGRPR
jgi:hypothetical protein